MPRNQQDPVSGIYMSVIRWKALPNQLKARLMAAATDNGIQTPATHWRKRYFRDITADLREWGEMDVIAVLREHGNTIIEDPDYKPHLREYTGHGPPITKPSKVSRAVRWDSVMWDRLKRYVEMKNEGRVEGQEKVTIQAVVGAAVRAYID